MAHSLMENVIEKVNEGQEYLFIVIYLDMF